MDTPNQKQEPLDVLLDSIFQQDGFPSNHGSGSFSFKRHRSLWKFTGDSHGRLGEKTSCDALYLSRQPSSFRRALLNLVNSPRITSTAIERWPFGETLCYLNPFFGRCLYLNTLLHLIAVSYERYKAIVKSPLTYNGKITKCRVLSGSHLADPGTILRWSVTRLGRVTIYI